jgi:hypothetical protein
MTPAVLALDIFLEDKYDLTEVPVTPILDLVRC